MQPFSKAHTDRGTSENLGHCAACGMKLVLPGLVSQGNKFCCHGCQSTPSQELAKLYTPDFTKRLLVSRAIHVAEEPEKVSEFLSKIEFLHLYEHKLERLQVTGLTTDGQYACATADGRFGVLKYHIELHFNALQGGGYQSTLCDRGIIKALQGTFAVKPAPGGCTVTHIENYEFHGGEFLRHLRGLYRPYVGLSMEREVRTLKRLVEEPRALGEAFRLNSPRELSVDPRVPVWDPAGKSAKPRRGVFARTPSYQTWSTISAFGLGALIGAAVFRGDSSIPRKSSAKAGRE